MKFIIRFTILLFTGISGLIAQTSDSKPAAGQTVVTSDQFTMDQARRTGIFRKNVVVTANDFKLTADEITVMFSAADNKIEKLIARGTPDKKVEIEQADRTTRSNQVEYLVLEDKIMLIGSPEVTQNKNIITGTTITIYRKDNRMDIDGKSKVLLYDVSAGKTLPNK